MKDKNYGIKGIVISAMPVIKVLLAVLFIVALLTAGIGNDSGQKSSEQKMTAGSSANMQVTEAESNSALKTAASSEDDSSQDYIAISPHYRYTIPDTAENIGNPYEPNAENETFCDFRHGDTIYTIRSYQLDYNSAGLSEVVKSSLSYFDDIHYISETSSDSTFGEILNLRFEATDENGNNIEVAGYYWYDSDPKICCLEISSDKSVEGDAEQMIMDSVYRISSNKNMPPYEIDGSITDPDVDEAMRSQVEDAMREYYEPKPDYTDRVLKP